MYKVFLKHTSKQKQFEFWLFKKQGQADTNVDDASRFFVILDRLLFAGNLTGSMTSIKGQFDCSFRNDRKNLSLVFLHSLSRIFRLIEVH